MVHHYGHVRELATVMLAQKHLEQQLLDTRASFAAGGYPANLQMPLSVKVMWFTESGTKDLLNLMWTCKPMATSVLTKTESQFLMHCLTPTHLPIPWEWDVFVYQYVRRLTARDISSAGKRFSWGRQSHTFKTNWIRYTSFGDSGRVVR